MDRTERFYRIDQLLQEKQVVPVETFLEELGVSMATFKRDITYLRDRLNAPIVWDRTQRGYCYEESDETIGPRFELPGLWFNASEIHAILTMEHLLTHLQPGLLATHVAPLRTRLRMLLTNDDHSADEVVSRIRVLHQGGRKVEQPLFEKIANALLSRRVLRILHLNRHRGEVLEREVSPQRLVFYRDNWYLDGWCHLRNDIRSFALDAMQNVFITNQKATDLPDSQLDQYLTAGYGIFGGAGTQTAVIRFSSERSRWVAHESWHPDQKGAFDAEGRWVLSFPYSNDTELVMDILRHGPDAEVLEPSELRDAIQKKLQETLLRYK
ncbi:MAG: YafY family transcriptional regulator [Magnetococcales bacterium]|nr:YafY family transcriptional regulator [Magnetococcales bacterium]